MDTSLLVLLVVIMIGVYVLQNQGAVNLGAIGGQRNIVLLAAALIMGYYVMNKMQEKAPAVTTTGAPKKTVKPYSEDFKSCGSHHDAPPEEPFEAPVDMPQVPGNFLDGSAKHAEMFEQKVTANLPYLVGSTLPQPSPECLTRNYLSRDLRPPPTIAIDENQSFPFGMSSVAATVAQSSGGCLNGKNIGVAEQI
jgi:hypothetical protein